jgi:uncharacterized protein (DUF58 family)
MLDELWPQARAAADALGPLRLAARARPSPAPGSHGQRQAGPGSAFWQYRPLTPGESSQAIDWRKSARADALLTREREREQPARLLLWVDSSASMDFSSAKAMPTKLALAWFIALGLSLAVLDADEQVAVPPLPVARGAQGLRASLAQMPRTPLLDPRARLADWVLVSDFLENGWDLTELSAAARGQGVRLCLVHIIDPAEAAFPFAGPVRFEGLEGEEPLESRDAAALRAEYLRAFAAHRERLSALASATGGGCVQVMTDAPRNASLAAAAKLLGAPR